MLIKLEGMQEENKEEHIIKYKSKQEVEPIKLESQPEQQQEQPHDEEVNKDEPVADIT